jgi:hypothetical protein
MERPDMVTVPEQLVVDPQGYVALPGEGGEAWRVFVHTGLRCARIPIPEMRSGLLVFNGGIEDDPAFEPDAIAVILTAEGLDTLIADLAALRAGIAPAELH